MSEEVQYQAFDGEVDDEESLLRQTQQARIRIANGIMGEQGVHKDKELVNSLQKMLDGIDKQVLGKRRAEAANKTAGAAQDVANALNGWVREKRAPRLSRHDELPEENAGYQPPVPPVPKGNIKEGELAPVGEKVDVETIMATAFAQQRPDQSEED